MASCPVFQSPSEASGDPGMNPEKPDQSRYVLGTPLRVTTYSDFIARCQKLCAGPESHAVDFSNTQIVTMRRSDPAFRAITGGYECFIPDGMPLIWCLNLQGAKLRDRVYGPTFMRRCILASPGPFKHYFLGGSENCVTKLKGFFVRLDPTIRIVGMRNGYFKPEQDQEIVDEINQLSPDFIWVGLGTPKQQEWIHRNMPQIKRGVVFAVGFAFDVNAGTKKDAPLWMQKRGLTWVFRLLSEPLRLGPRYLRYNSLFLFYLLWDGIRGCAFKKNGGSV